jgi:hypothetical protein
MPHLLKLARSEQRPITTALIVDQPDDTQLTINPTSFHQARTATVGDVFDVFNLTTCAI